MTQLCKSSVKTDWEHLFIWGLYAIPGGEWNGQVYNGAAEWLKSWAKVPAEEWLQLMKQWNPQNFDAKKWAKMAKDYGSVNTSKLRLNTTKVSAYGQVSLQNTP